MKGLLITFEGCDGVGKSTQIRLLKEHLERSRRDVLLIREPGGNPISEQIRKIILDANNKNMSPICELLLYFSARAQLIQEVIAPALAEGKYVICDRYIDSTFAYQGVARGLGVDTVSSLIELVCKDYMPDATVFLDLEPHEGFARKGGASQSDRMELEKADFYTKVYQGFKQAAITFPDRFVTVRPLGNREDTHAAIVKALTQKGLL